MKVIEFRLRAKIEEDYDESDTEFIQGIGEALEQLTAEEIGIKMDCTWVEVQGEEDKLDDDLPEDLLH